MFQAKVTKRIKDGYAIETVIDGKPLRGILFSSKLEDYQPAAIPNSSRWEYDHFLFMSKLKVLFNWSHNSLLIISGSGLLVGKLVVCQMVIIMANQKLQGFQWIKNLLLTSMERSPHHMSPRQKLPQLQFQKIKHLLRPLSCIE